MAIDLLIKLEGMHLKAYLDGVKIPTIGIGSIKKPDGTPIKMGDTCSESEAYDWCNAHLNKCVYPAVNNLRRQYNFSDQVFASLSSLGYNIGSALTGDSIPAALKSGSIDQISAAFRLFVYVRINGVKKFDQGLDNRRIIEIKYFNPAYPFNPKYN
jgi:lysozyme